MLPFKTWLEMRDVPDDMKSTLMSYLSLGLDPKDGLMMPFRALNRPEIISKLKSWNLFSQLPPEKQNQMIGIVHQPNANLSMLAAALEDAFRQRHVEPEMTETL
jgi:hypothetical protein